MSTRLAEEIADALAQEALRVAQETGDERLTDELCQTVGASLSDNVTGADYSCNCILNYLYGEMEGKSVSGFTGPMTFGEIAYMLLNQTLVRLELQKAA